MTKEPALNNFHIINIRKMSDLKTLSVEERKKIVDQECAKAEKELEKAIQEGKKIKAILKIQAKYYGEVELTKEEKKALIDFDKKGIYFLEERLEENRNLIN